MRKIIVLFTFLFLSSMMSMAQRNEHQKFDPQQFEANLEARVLADAGFDKAETAKFLPIYREMRKKQVEVLEKQRCAGKGRPTTEQECAEAIKARDKMEIETKQILQAYHLKMLRVVPAPKVMKVIRSIENYHREAFRNFNQKEKKPGMHKGNHSHRR